MSSEHTDPVQEWLQKQKVGDLHPSYLDNYWGKTVPYAYSVAPNCNCLNIGADEHLIQKILISPLERLIFEQDNDSTDYKSIYQVLQNQEKKYPKICGKVFNEGETIYSCKDCRKKRSTIMCKQCFDNSVHKDHDHETRSAGKQAYCDCRQTFSWKQSSHCGIHLPMPEDFQITVDNPINLLPKDMVDRVLLVFKTALMYCMDVLRRESLTSLPSNLNQSSEELYVIIISNRGQVDQEDQIQTALTEATILSPSDAEMYANIITENGCCGIKCGSYDVCKIIKDCFDRLSSSSPLKADVRNAYLFVHQKFAIRLIQWLMEVSGRVEGFRRLLVNILFDENFVWNSKQSESGKCIIEEVLKTEILLWKNARLMWHQLFISRILVHPDCKPKFAKIFLQNYPLLRKIWMKSNCKNDLFITSLSTQILTSSAVVTEMLIEKEDAITVMMDTMLKYLCSSYRSVKTGKLSFDDSYVHDEFKRILFILYDVNCILVDRPLQWNKKLRRNFLQGLGAVITLMSWLQGINPITIQKSKLSSYDPNWKGPLLLQKLLFINIINDIVDWCGSDYFVLIKAFRACLKCVQAIEKTRKMAEVTLEGHSANCICFDVGKEDLSFYYPVSRFIAGLFLHFHKYNLQFESEELEMKNKVTVEFLMEPSLCSLVLIAQKETDMWESCKALNVHTTLYRGVAFRTDLYDKDVIMVQTAACLIEPNQFLIHLLNKYAIVSWVNWSSKTTHLNSKVKPNKHFQILADHFLSLLINVVSERYVCGIAYVSDEDVLKKEIMQYLCIQPMSYDELCEKISTEVKDRADMENIIEQIAVKEIIGEKYKLKQEFYKDFNLHYYHYTEEERVNAEEWCRRLFGEDICCPPPMTPNLTDTYSSLTRFLQCDIMIRIMMSVITAQLDYSKCMPDMGTASFRESQFCKILHLIGFALHEEVRHVEQSKHSFFFTEKVVEEGLLSKLESLRTKNLSKSTKALLDWIITKFINTEKLKMDCFQAKLNVLN